MQACLDGCVLIERRNFCSYIVALFGLKISMLTMECRCFFVFLKVILQLCLGCSCIVAICGLKMPKMKIECSHFCSYIVLYLA